MRMHRGSSNDFVTTGDVDVPESAFRYPPEVAFPWPPLFAPQPAYCCGEIGTA